MGVVWIRHASALSASVVLLVTTLAAPVMAGDKVTLCHKPGAPAEKTLKVAAAAVKAHLRHGDVRGPCAAKGLEEDLGRDLVVAYSDLDGNAGFGSGDVLIAKLVDADGSGDPSPGDRIVMGRYPTDLAATSFADWGPGDHTVTAVSVATTSVLMAWSGEDSHVWEVNSDRRYESYTEDKAGAFSDLVDSFDMDGDKLLVGLGSPSQPSRAVGELAERAGDDRFIDIDFYD